MVPLVLAVGAALSLADDVSADFTRARDPGLRTGPTGAGNPFSTLTPSELEFFLAGKEDFEELEEVDEGLGPVMNLDGCGGCHSQPAVGGTSPPVNPQVAFATKGGATNRVPSFIRLDGPIREARFVRNRDGSPDGGVHALFTIKGRPEAAGCNLGQEDFAAQVQNRNVVFRIPTPVFGAGLMEQIPDSALVANAAANASQKAALGISGKFNRNGNDGTISRFGWKAQNKSLLLFSGEAYNVEMGITNELFQQERNETPSCQFAKVPNDVTNQDAATVSAGVSAIERFAVFQRFLAPPTPSTNTPGGSDSIGRGKTLFASTGCAYCHTPTLSTGDSTIGALAFQPVNLFSDLLVHDMGPDLADGVSQGGANGREFRSSPLWGLGQRIFFLHDGRTRDLLEAIAFHKSGSTTTRDASEANEVIRNFNNLSESRKQDILNFLRSL
jgi:hypothetical protein